ncbi:MAG: DNA-protecting protein DprA [Treponema sp.]|nr:DNA-protecting protein DprA [Treponema sp.]
MKEIDVVLSSFSFLTLREKVLLRDNLDSLDTLAVLSIKDLSVLTGRDVKAYGFNPLRSIKLAEKALVLMEAKDIKYVRYDDEKFPPLLREIRDPPYILFYRGNPAVLEKTCVSLVGTRSVCREAAKASFSFASEATRDGLCVVSGLAYGVDSFAHKGSLSSGETACSCAVLPCGLDTVVPYGNRSLAAEILKKEGLLITEYMPGTPAESFRFVQRNRIIAALSEATVVMQAPCSSGALITADFAVDFNRDLLFHKACFCDEAKRIGEVLLKRETSPEKRSRVPERYVSEGATVIADYDEFLVTLKNMRNGIFVKNKQLELF